MAKITLYKDVNFSGRNLIVTQNLADLNNEDFNDEVSSCIVESGTWMLYKDVNYQGDVSILNVGNYGSAEAMGLPNDSLSSLRAFPEVNGPTILLFEDSNYCGRMVVLTGADSDLNNVNFNDKTSSIIVLNGTWNVYTDVNFKGTSWTLREGRYPSATNFDNDVISSVMPT